MLYTEASATKMMMPANLLFHKDMVKKERLGRYLGLKDSMTLVASTGGSLILSKILDAYRFADQEILGFRIIGILCIGICVVDITCLTLIREPENVKHVEPLNIRKAIQMPLTDQNYRNILIFFCDGK